MSPPIRNPESNNGKLKNGAGASLAANNVQKTYSGRRVVDDVSVNVKQGEVVGLLGANGAGKTTTFYMLVALEQTENGNIVLNARSVTHLPTYLLPRPAL